MGKRLAEQVEHRTFREGERLGNVESGETASAELHGCGARGVAVGRLLTGAAIGAGESGERGHIEPTADAAAAHSWPSARRRFSFASVAGSVRQMPAVRMATTRA
jgi:hypothetical protein